MVNLVIQFKIRLNSKRAKAGSSWYTQQYWEYLRKSTNVSPPSYPSPPGNFEATSKVQQNISILYRRLWSTLLKAFDDPKRIQSNWCCSEKTDSIVQQQSEIGCSPSPTSRTILFMCNHMLEGKSQYIKYQLSNTLAIGDCMAIDRQLYTSLPPDLYMGVIFRQQGNVSLFNSMLKSIAR